MTNTKNTKENNKVVKTVAKTPNYKSAACGYSCLNYLNKLANVTYHVTKQGNTIIDYMA